METSQQHRLSPLSCLPTLPLTESGLLNLDRDDGEVELLSRQSIELRFLSIPISHADSHHDWIDRDWELQLTLTTHRLVFQSFKLRETRFLHLSNVSSFESSGGEWITNRSYKIVISTYSDNIPEMLLVFRSSNDRNDRESVHEGLEKALLRRTWEEYSRLAEKKKLNSVETLARRKVGIDAVLTRNKLKLAQNSQIADQAFAGMNKGNKSTTGDKRHKNDDGLEFFMREAGELMNIVRRYVAMLEKRNTDSKNSGIGKDLDETDEDAIKMISLLEDMGMTMALSQKETTGLKNDKKNIGGDSQYDSYHQKLARQIFDFLKKSNRLKNDFAGMMTLTDLYCLFNRARGTNLISPDDLLSALNELKCLGLDAYQIREFPSGLLVVQDSDFDDVSIANKLVALTKRTGKITTDCNFIHIGITALDASRILKMSALLANEQLLSAERMGYLCRDVTLEGIRFHENKFASNSSYALSEQ